MEIKRSGGEVSVCGVNVGYGVEIVVGEGVFAVSKRDLRLSDGLFRYGDSLSAGVDGVVECLLCVLKFQF